MNALYLFIFVCFVRLRLLLLLCNVLRGRGTRRGCLGFKRVGVPLALVGEGVQTLHRQAVVRSLRKSPGMRRLGAQHRRVVLCHLACTPRVFPSDRDGDWIGPR